MEFAHDLSRSQYGVHPLFLKVSIRILPTICHGLDTEFAHYLWGWGGGGEMHSF